MDIYRVLARSARRLEGLSKINYIALQYMRVCVILYILLEAGPNRVVKVKMMMK